MGGRSTKSARRSNFTDLQAAKEELDSLYQQLEIMQEISKLDHEYVQSAESIITVMKNLISIYPDTDLTLALLNEQHVTARTGLEDRTEVLYRKLKALSSEESDRVSVASVMVAKRLKRQASNIFRSHSGTKDIALNKINSDASDSKSRLQSRLQERIKQSRQHVVNGEAVPEHLRDAVHKLSKQLLVTKTFSAGRQIKTAMMPADATKIAPARAAPASDASVSTPVSFMDLRNDSPGPASSDDVAAGHIAPMASSALARDRDAETDPATRQDVTPNIIDLDDERYGSHDVPRTDSKAPSSSPHISSEPPSRVMKATPLVIGTRVRKHLRSKGTLELERLFNKNKISGHIKGRAFYRMICRDLSEKLDYANTQRVFASITEESKSGVSLEELRAWIASDHTPFV